MLSLAFRYRILFTIVLALIATSCVIAGGGPQNVLIVVNANSTDSLQIGNAYRRARDIPYSHVLSINTSTAFQIPYQTYLDEIESPIRTYLKNHQLVDQITSIVLTRGVPQMVTVSNGRSTASLLAGMGIPDRQDLTAQFANPYYNAPDAFSHRNPTLRGMYMVTVLNGYHTGDILRLISQGASADGKAPDGRYVLQTMPKASQIANEIAKMLAIRNLKAEVTTSLPQDRTQLMGYFSGGVYSGLNKSLVASCTFQPGALVDLAQNFSAAPNNFDETAPPVLLPVSQFIQAGVTGIHGVVGEAGLSAIPIVSSPQQLLGKYTSGYSLAESFYAALPLLSWQNIVIGDPLCAPYVQRPVVTAELPAGPIKGIVPVRVSASSPVRGTTISRIDAYLDDQFLQTVYEPDKTRITLYIGEEIVHYLVPHGATLRTVLEEVADTINADPILQGPDGVRAMPSLATSTLTLIARHPGSENNEIPIGIDIETDTPASPRIVARVDGGWLSGGGQDPVPAMATISLLGRQVKPGDQILVQIQQEHLTLTVTPETASLASLPDALVNLINNDTELQKSDGVLAIRGAQGMPYVILQARTPGDTGNAMTFQLAVRRAEGSQLHVYPETASQLRGGHDGTASIQSIHFMMGESTAQGTLLLNTDQLADGYHRLRVVAIDGSLAQAQGACNLPITITNTGTPPVVTLPEALQPAAIEATIPVTAAENVTQVNILVDGQLLGSSTTPPFTVRIPLTSLGRGQHDLWAEGLDADGHRFVSPPASLTVLTPPEVFSISPNYTATAGGTTHRISGSGFQDTSVVRLTGVSVRSMKYINPNLLEVVSDTGPAQQGVVAVTNADGTTNLPTISFEYYQPRVDRVQISPAREVIMPGRSVQFIAHCFDQHDFPLQPQLSWDATGGTISPTGLYTAGKKLGAFQVRASMNENKSLWDVPITIGPATVQDGLLNHWLVLGAFPDPNYTALEESQIPEETVTPSRGETVGDLTWHTLYSPNGYIDFTSDLALKQNAVAYTHVYLLAPTDTSCSLVYGSDDGIRLWLNGALLQSLRTRRAPDPNQNTTAITLKAGWNRLLVKVDQGTGGWGFYMRLKANDGAVLPAIKYALEAPNPAEAK